MKKIIFIITILLITSCMQKKTQSEKAFTSYMNTLQKKGEYLQFLGFQGNDGKIMKFAPYFADSSKKMQFKILKTEEKQNNSTITVSVKSPDLSYYNTLFPKDSSKENYDKYLGEKAEFLDLILKEEEDLKFQEKTVFVYMIRKDGHWILDLSSDKNNEFEGIINHKIFE